MTDPIFRPLTLEPPFLRNFRTLRGLTNHVVHIRRLAPAELAAFRDHLVRLDTQSRINRFGHAVSDAFLKSYAERTMGQRGIVKACFIDGECRAAGEAFLANHADYDAEAAFSVEKRWQGIGLGTLLFRRLVRTIRNQGACRIRVICLRHNVPMRRIAEKMGGDIQFMADGIVAHLETSESSLLSLSIEAVEDASFMVLHLPLEG